jgi:hypothetical protein
LLGSRLETLVAGAPEFWPGRSFLDFVAGLRFLPLRPALLLPLARRELTSARVFFCFCILVGARLLLRGGAGDIGAAISPTASAAAKMTLCMS